MTNHRNRIGMVALIAIMLALGIAATARATDQPPDPPFTVSLSGDVKPLPWWLDNVCIGPFPWVMQNTCAGKAVGW